MPSRPLIGLSVTPSTVQPGRLLHQATIRPHTARCTAASRTTPPAPTAAGPASNCGFISATAQAPGAHSASAAGRQGRQPDEARVAHQGADALADPVRGQVAGVDALVQHHARVVAQLPGELATADIDRMDARRPAMQQHVGEPAGGGPDVEADAPGRREREMIERMGELDAAAGDPGVVLAAHVERRVGRQRFPRLRNSPLAREHPPGQDQSLAAGPALGETSLDQKLVRPLLHRPASGLARLQHCAAGLRGAHNAVGLHPLSRVPWRVICRPAELGNGAPRFRPIGRLPQGVAVNCCVR